MMNTGKFISIEGQDGSGKTTNLAFICKLLDENGIKHIVTREPGGTELGESIRELILGRDMAIAPTPELLMMFAARAQHVEQVIQPAIKEGKWVVCDRFTDATYAYQGGGHGLNTGLIAQAEQLAIANYAPDLTILLDLPIEVSAQRSDSRGGHKDRFESQASAFKGRVREAYLQRQATEPDRMKLIDASESLKKVRASIHSLLKQYIAEVTAGE